MHKTFTFVSVLYVLLAGCAVSPLDDTAASTDALETEALAACVVQSACNDASAPTLGPKRAFHHFASNLVSHSGHPNHRGRDAIFVAGQPQTLIGKFAYGIIDKDIHGEEVDVFVERNCGGAWTKLGTGTTTDDGDHATVDGIEDDGGRVYFDLPTPLPRGRHRIRMVVAGDQTSADLVVDVVPAGTTYFVSDVDGTLTTSEAAAWTSLLTGNLPDARPDAAKALSNLAKKGIRPLYLTSRPDWLKNRTREFLDANGFPPGLVYTSSHLLPEVGDGSGAYKTEVLTRYAGHGAKFTWAFGNMSHDADAYDAVGIEPLSQRIFVGIDDAHGGRRIESYGEVVGVTSATPRVCR